MHGWCSGTLVSAPASQQEAVNLSQCKKVDRWPGSHVARFPAGDPACRILFAGDYAVFETWRDVHCACLVTRN